MKIQPEFNIAAILSKISADDVVSNQVQRKSGDSYAFETFFEAALQQIDDPQLAATIATLNQSGIIMPDSSEAFVVPQVATDSLTRALPDDAAPTFRTLQLLNGRSVITSLASFSVPVVEEEATLDSMSVVDSMPEVATTEEPMLASPAPLSAKTGGHAYVEQSAEAWIGSVTRTRSADVIMISDERPAMPKPRLTVVPSPITPLSAADLAPAQLAQVMQRAQAAPLVTPAQSAPLTFVPTAEFPPAQPAQPAELPLVKPAVAAELPLVQPAQLPPVQTALIAQAIMPAQVADAALTTLASQDLTPSPTARSTSVPPSVTLISAADLAPAQFGQVGQAATAHAAAISAADLAPAQFGQVGQAATAHAAAISAADLAPAQFGQMGQAATAHAAASSVKATMLTSAQPSPSQSLSGRSRSLKTEGLPDAASDLSESVERRQSTEAWLNAVSRSTPVATTLSRINLPSQPSPITVTAVDSALPPLALMQESNVQSVTTNNLQVMTNAPSGPTQATALPGRTAERWMHVDDLSEQFGSVIKSTLLDRSVAGQTSLKIMLFPENMGSIEAEIIENNRSITVNLVAQNDEVVRMLRDNSQVLRDAMGQSGAFELNILKERSGSDGQASRDPSASGNNRSDARDAGTAVANSDAVLNSQHASDTGALDTYV